MKTAATALFAIFAVHAPAFAAEDRSPYDRNPVCLDRNVDANKAECLIMDDGTPRHRYPPRKAVTPPPKPPAPANAPAPPRETAPLAPRKGG
jgi:hypothetical protein